MEGAEADGNDDEAEQEASEKQNDTNGDKVADDQRANADVIARIFREWDSDGDKFISAEELSSVLTRLGMQDRTAAQLLQTIDTNQDGKIDYEEFAKWLKGSEDGKTLKLKMEQFSVASCAGVMSASKRPLPEIGAMVLVQERLGVGFPASVQYAHNRHNIGLLLDGIRPQQKARVGEHQILPLDEALEAGWFPRWEFGHQTDGWRTYALGDSYQIETAYHSWLQNKQKPGADTITLSGSGKMGDTDILVRFIPHAAFKGVPHLAVQLNTKSNHIRPVRRTLRDAASVNVDSKEGWCLTFGTLPVNVVTDVWSFVNEGGMTESEAMAKLQSFVYRKRIDDMPVGEPRKLARLRYGGSHIDAIASEQENSPVVVWEWFHGGEHREWKSYRGVECELLERRHQLQSKHALMNGGKPADGWSTKPLRVLFNVGWTSQGGKYFAAHTQVDLVSRKRRGVRRQEASKGTWDYIFFFWVRKYNLVSAAEIYVTYEKYLQQLLDGSQESEDVRRDLRVQAEEQLEALQNDCPKFVEAPQDEVPEAFLCPIGNTLMLTPAFVKDSSSSARMEREVLVKWAREKGTHPFTHEPMSAQDIETDEDLINQITEWLRSFTEPKVE